MRYRVTQIRRNESDPEGQAGNLMKWIVYDSTKPRGEDVVAEFADEQAANWKAGMLNAGKAENWKYG